MQNETSKPATRRDLELQRLIDDQLIVKQAQLLSQWLLESNKNSKGASPNKVLRTCVVVCQQNSTVAIVLRTMLYWLAANQKGKLKYHAARWNGMPALVKSAVELAEETGLTENQADRALRALAMRGFWARHVAKFSGAPTRHFVPDYPCILAAIAEVNEQMAQLLATPDSKAALASPAISPVQTARAAAEVPNTAPT